MSGKKVKAIRHRLKLTQHELARKIGVTRTTVRRWKFDLMRIKQSATTRLMRLARAL
jgi:DNA-binding transcriptional regulator YiaG